MIEKHTLTYFTEQAQERRPFGRLFGVFASLIRLPLTRGLGRKNAHTRADDDELEDGVDETFIKAFAASRVSSDIEVESGDGEYT